MASVNKAIIVGFLGRDPETRYAPDGTAFTTISIATSYAWTDKSSGEKKEETEWHRIVFSGRTAEVAGEYLKKGTQAYIEGSIRTRKWQDREGNDRYTTEIKGHNLVMLGRRGEEAPREPDHSGPTRTPPAEGPAPRAATDTAAKKPAGRFDDMEDDIPF